MRGRRIRKLCKSGEAVNKLGFFSVCFFLLLDSRGIFFFFSSFLTLNTPRGARAIVSCNFFYFLVLSFLSFLSFST
jgi:hypothetical protein